MQFKEIVEFKVIPNNPGSILSLKDRLNCPDGDAKVYSDFIPEGSADKFELMEITSEGGVTIWTRDYVFYLCRDEAFVRVDRNPKDRKAAHENTDDLVDELDGLMDIGSDIVYYYTDAQDLMSNLSADQWKELAKIYSCRSEEWKDTLDCVLRDYKDRTAVKYFELLLVSS